MVQFAQHGGVEALRDIIENTEDITLQVQCTCMTYLYNELVVLYIQVHV